MRTSSSWTKTAPSTRISGPLKIAILNLMPTKITTETQLLRLLGNTPIQVEVTLVRTNSHQSKNTPEEHLLAFYQTFRPDPGPEVRRADHHRRARRAPALRGGRLLGRAEGHHGLGLAQRLFAASTSAGAHRRPCTTSSASPSIRCRPSSSACSRTGSSRSTSSCCAALTTSSTSRIPGTPRSAAADIDKVPELDVLVESEEAGVYVWQPGTGGRSLSPGTPSTIR